MSEERSAVLCRYYLHGACTRGSSCLFSHSLENAESQVCRYYLKGACAYGERCRYLHVKPEWVPARGGGANEGSTYRPPPTVLRPSADNLADQLPISQLRLGGQAAGSSAAGPSGSSRPAAAPAAARGGGSAPLPRPILLPLPVELPQDPFNGAAAAEQDEEAQPREEAEEWGGEEWGEGGEGYWEGQEEHGGGGGEAYWGEGGEEGYGWGGEDGGYGGEEGWWEEEEEEEEGGAWQQQQQRGLQPPAQPEPAWSLPPAASGEDQQQLWGAGVPPALRSLCMSWFKTGACPKGSACKLVHGSLCQHCGKYALHPADAEAREQHLAECRQRHERLAARARSSTIECGICLEPVLSKAAPGERRFGLLTGCDHPYCLKCIRSWRQKTDGGADVDTALRTCPVCRVTSHYVVPSLTWPSSSEEKEQIIAGYKAKLGTIHCQYFDRGEGTCPFGTSCFFRHEFPDGRLEEPSLRKAADEEGVVRIVQPVRLSDFIALAPAGRMLGRRRR